MSMSDKPTRTYPPGLGAPTPWGKANFRYDDGPGVAFYSTPSHGGYRLDRVANQRIPQDVRAATFRQQGLAGWYEEDCDFMAVVVFLPELFTPEKVSEVWRRLETTAEFYQGEFATACLAHKAA